MKDRRDLRSTSLLAVGVSILSLFVWAGAVATGAERHSGSVVAVDAATRTLVIDEIGANAKEQRLRLRLAPGLSWSCPSATSTRKTSRAPSRRCRSAFPTSI